MNVALPCHLKVCKSKRHGRASPCREWLIQTQPLACDILLHRAKVFNIDALKIGEISDDHSRIFVWGRLLDIGDSIANLWVAEAWWWWEDIWIAYFCVVEVWGLWEDAFSFERANVAFERADAENV